MGSRPKSRSAAAADLSAARRGTTRRGTPATIASPVRPTTHRAKTYTSPKIDIGFATPEHRFARADIEILGIFHGEASYEGRIFLNNPKADASTPKTIENGYAGSFNIFGHGGCTGDPGHCELSGAKVGTYDRRNPHPLTPAKKRVGVTAALKQVALTAEKATVTIVPVVTAANSLCDTTNVFRCEGMRFVSYNS